MLKGVLKDELLEIREKYGDARKTEIQDVEDEIDVEDLIEGGLRLHPHAQRLYQAHERERVHRAE